MIASKASHPSNIALFKEEISVMQKLANSKHTVHLVDYFETSEDICAVIDNPNPETLSDVAKQFPPQGCSVVFVQNTILALAKKVKSLHDKGIVHRTIGLASVTVRPSRQQLFKVHKLRDFSLAHHLKKNRVIT